MLNERPVLGGFEWFETHDTSQLEVICQVGSPAIKLRLVQKALALNLRFCSVVHPSAAVTKFVDVGKGSVISAGCILTNHITIGDHVTLNLATTVGHDGIIEGFCTVSPGVHISGNVQLRTGCEVGTGAVIIPEIEVGEWSVVGAGAVVVRNVPPNTTVVGVPARVIKEQEPGWHQRVAEAGLGIHDAQ